MQTNVTDFLLDCMSGLVVRRTGATAPLPAGAAGKVLWHQCWAEGGAGYMQHAAAQGWDVSSSRRDSDSNASTSAGQAGAAPQHGAGAAWAEARRDTIPPPVPAVAPPAPAPVTALMPPSAVPSPRPQSVHEAATVVVRGFPAQLWLYTQRAFLQRIKGTEMASYLLVSVVAGSIMGIVSCGNDLLILR